MQNTIKENVQKAINDQINKELYSAYLYLLMANYFESRNLKGIAKWLFVQNKEEVCHADKSIDFLNERGGRVDLAQIEVLKKDWSSILEAFEDTYNHEAFITTSID